MQIFTEFFVICLIVIANTFVSNNYLKHTGGNIAEIIFKPPIHKIVDEFSFYLIEGQTISFTDINSHAF